MNLQDANFALEIVVGLGLLGAIGKGIQSILQRNILKAKASSEDATATAVVIAAARELVDPLRKELADVRRESKAGIAMERQKVNEVRGELRQAMSEARELRLELAGVREEMDELRRENAMYRDALRSHNIPIPPAV